MARRRKQKTSIFSYVAVTVVTVAAVCALTIWTGILNKKNDEYVERENQLYEEIEQESSRYDELNEQYKYVKTEDYVIDVARTCFGLVNEGEILVKPNENE